MDDGQRPVLSDGCTGWIDGWWWNPTQWFHCCASHDAGGSHWELFLCVGQTGGPLEWAMAAVMFIGLLLFNPIYRKWKLSQPGQSAGFFIGANLMDLNLGHTQLIIEEARKRGVLRNQLAYILATAKWETAHTMQPVKEAYWLSETWRRNNLRYYPWYGRGFVQLTWERNYRHAGGKLDRDFISDPEAVMEPQASAEILVVGSMEGWFTGKKIPDYITLNRSDFRGARRVINGTDKASAIAEIAVQYDRALLAEGYGLEPLVPDAPDLQPEVPQPDEAITEKPLTQSTTLLSTIIGAVSGILSALTDNPIAQTILVLALVGALAWIARERILNRR